MIFTQSSFRAGDYPIQTLSKLVFYKTECRTNRLLKGLKCVMTPGGEGRGAWGQAHTQCWGHSGEAPTLTRSCSAFSSFHPLGSSSPPLPPPPPLGDPQGGGGPPGPGPLACGAWRSSGSMFDCREGCFSALWGFSGS